MGSHQFDRLARSLAADTSRRQVLRGTLGPCAVLCANQPGPRKAACKQACRQCNNDPTSVCQHFQTGQLTCCPEGDICAEGICCVSFDQLCFGTNGVTCCPEDPFCDFATGECGPPAVCGPESGCLGGTCAAGCFCVSSFEGDGACVDGAFTNRDAQQCETSAGCGGGVCVDATDCCPGSVQVCFPPEAICATDGAGAAGGMARLWCVIARGTASRFG
jgi:hypothetical protein